MLFLHPLLIIVCWAKGMKFYRSRAEIISQILGTANGGDATKSQIAYKTFLNYSKLKEYLTILTQSDLLSYDGETHTFKTTEKGLTLLQAYNQIDQILKEQQI
jgi:predicted transcriptional regulator